MSDDLHFERIGGIAGPNGDTWVGRLPESGFAVFAIEPLRVLFLLNLTETALLASALETAGVGAWTDHALGGGESQVVAVLRPRPLEIQILALQADGVPAVGVKLRQRTLSQFMIPVALATDMAGWLHAAAEAEAPHAPRPVEGEVLQAGDSGLRLRSNGVRTFRVIQGMSFATGEYGEFVPIDELPVGGRVRVDVWEASGGAPFALAVQVLGTRPVPKSNPGTRSEWLEDCALGNEMNELMRAGDLLGARSRLSQLIGRMKGRKALHAWFAAKIALSSLFLAARVEDAEMAHPIWTEKSPEPLVRMGIPMLEAGQVSDRDLLVYHMISAWLQSRQPDSRAAQKAVDKLMQLVYDQSVALGDSAMAALALRNWKLYLNEIHEAEPSERAAAAWRACCAAFGSRPTDKLICFPLPEAWAVDWDETQDRTLGDAGSTKSAPRQAAPTTAAVGDAAPTTAAVRDAAPARSSSRTVPAATAAKSAPRAASTVRKPAVETAAPKGAFVLYKSTRVFLAGLAGLALVIALVLGGMRWMAREPTGPRLTVEGKPRGGGRQVEKDGTVISRSGDSIEVLLKVLGEPSERLLPQGSHFGFYVFETPAWRLLVHVDGGAPGNVTSFELKPSQQ